MADPYKDAPWQQGDILRADELNAMQAGLSPIGTVIPWALPWNKNNALNDYSNVSDYAPFHLPATGGVYPNSVAPTLASLIGHTYAPYSGGGWVKVGAGNTPLGPSETGGEILAFWTEAEMRSVFKPESSEAAGATRTWANKFAMCFFGQWTNARVCVWRWDGAPGVQKWDWHFNAGNGDMTKVLQHEVVGGEFMPRVFNPSGDHYPIKAHNASNGALEDVDDSGVYEFEFEPGGANVRQWRLITLDGFVVPDMRGRSPIGSTHSPFGQPNPDFPIENWSGPVTGVALGQRWGDWRLQQHNHLLYTYTSSGGIHHIANTGNGVAMHAFKSGDLNTSDYLTAPGYGQNMSPHTGTNFLVFAGQKITDPTPLAGTGIARNGEPARVPAVTTAKMMFERLGHSDVSDEERDALMTELTGEPVSPPPVDEPPATRTTTTTRKAAKRKKS